MPKHRTLAFAALAVIVSACGGSSGAPEQGTPELQPSGWSVYADPLDARAATFVDEQGNRVDYEGTKDGEGGLEAVTAATVTPLGEPPIRVEFDANGLPRRFEMRDGGGLQADWRPDGLVRFRVFDGLGAIVDDAWFDSTTRLEVPPPQPSPVALGPEVEPAPLAAGLHPADDKAAPPIALASSLTALEPLTVTVGMLGCNNSPSIYAAANVEECIVTLQVGSSLRIPVRAERNGDSFVARLPRNITPAEFTEDLCLQLANTLAELCILNSEQAVAALLFEFCASRSPAAVLQCAAASVAASLYCIAPETINQGLCQSAFTVLSPWSVAWRLGGPRTIVAEARIRSCDDTLLRTSQPQAVTRENLTAGLSIDACLDQEGTGWTSLSACSAAGIVNASSAEGIRILTTQNPLQGFVSVPPPIPVLGPTTLTDTCFWPFSNDPLYAIDIRKTGTMQAFAGDDGGGFTTTLDILRTQDQLRAPTPAEIAAGYTETEPPCLTQPEEVATTQTTVHRMRLRPFQQLHVQMQLSGSGGAGVEQEMRVRIAWPILTFGLQEQVLSGPGSRTFTISHEALRFAYENIQNQIPVPQVPGLTTSTSPTPAQCLQVWLVVTARTALETAQEISGTASGQAQYSLTIVPE